MEREELLLQFREEKKQMIENYQMLFSKNLLEQAEKLGELVIENLKLLNQKVKEQKKRTLDVFVFCAFKGGCHTKEVSNIGTGAGFSVVF